MLLAHEFSLRLGPDDDPRALGGAVTQALCGHWDHEGPCRWPHRTDSTACADGSTTTRVLFRCAPRDEAEVRRRIVAAVRRGWLDGPEGRSAWTLEREQPTAVTPDEAETAPPDP